MLADRPKPQSRGRRTERQLSHSHAHVAASQFSFSSLDLAPWCTKPQPRGPVPSMRPRRRPFEADNAEREGRCFGVDDGDGTKKQTARRYDGGCLGWKRARDRNATSLPARRTGHHVTSPWPRRSPDKASLFAYKGLVCHVQAFTVRSAIFT